MNLADIGMIQGRDGLRLALEAFAELSSRNFDRNITLQTRVSGSIDLSHTARADLREDFIGAEFVACGHGIEGVQFSLSDVPRIGPG